MKKSTRRDQNPVQVIDEDLTPPYSRIPIEDESPLPSGPRYQPSGGTDSSPHLGAAAVLWAWLSVISLGMSCFLIGMTSYDDLLEFGEKSPERIVWLFNSTTIRFHRPPETEISVVNSTDAMPYPHPSEILPPPATPLDMDYSFVSPVASTPHSSPSTSSGSSSEEFLNAGSWWTRVLIDLSVIWLVNGFAGLVIGLYLWGKFGRVALPSANLDVVLPPTSFSPESSPLRSLFLHGVITRGSRLFGLDSGSRSRVSSTVNHQTLQPYEVVFLADHHGAMRALNDEETDRYMSLSKRTTPTTTLSPPRLGPPAREAASVVEHHQDDARDLSYDGPGAWVDDDYKDEADDVWTAEEQEVSALEWSNGESRGSFYSDVSADQRVSERRQPSAPTTYEQRPSAPTHPSLQTPTDAKRKQMMHGRSVSNHEQPRQPHPGSAYPPGQFGGLPSGQQLTEPVSFFLIGPAASFANHCCANLSPVLGGLALAASQGALKIGFWSPPDQWVPITALSGCYGIFVAFVFTYYFNVWPTRSETVLLAVMFFGACLLPALNWTTINLDSSFCGIFAAICMSASVIFSRVGVLLGISCVTGFAARSVTQGLLGSFGILLTIAIPHCRRYALSNLPGNWIRLILVPVAAGVFSVLSAAALNVAFFKSPDSVGLASLLPLHSLVVTVLCWIVFGVFPSVWMWIGLLLIWSSCALLPLSTWFSFELSPCLSHSLGIPLLRPALLSDSPLLQPQQEPRTFGLEYVSPLSLQVPSATNYCG